MEDRQFARLLDALGYSWRGYRRVRKGAKRRVARHMQDLGCRDLDGYLERLAADPQAMTECERRMAVSISRFFRDLGLWRDLYERILPELASSGRGRIRVWFAGCACGEEVYSFRILLRELDSAGNTAPDAEIVATDLDPVCLQRARRGVYPAGALRDAGSERQKRWFTPVEEDKFAVLPGLREGIRWRRHNILLDPPPAEAMDLVFLRNNLLTYCRSEVAAPALQGIAEVLIPGGFLVIGSEETLPEKASTGLLGYGRCIYQKTVETGPEGRSGRLCSSSDGIE